MTKLYVSVCKYKCPYIGEEEWDVSCCSTSLDRLKEYIDGHKEFFDQPENESWEILELDVVDRETYKLLEACKVVSALGGQSEIGLKLDVNYNEELEAISAVIPHGEFLRLQSLTPLNVGTAVWV